MGDSGAAAAITPLRTSISVERAPEHFTPDNAGLLVLNGKPVAHAVLVLACEQQRVPKCLDLCQITPRDSLQISIDPGRRLEKCVQL